MSDFEDARGVLWRTCLDCGQTKPLGDFHTSSRRKYGRGSYCQLCYNERSKQSYRKRMLEKHGRDVREPFKAPEGHRRCPDCAAVKPLEDFPLNRSKPGSYERYCLPCHNKRSRENKIKNHGSTRNYHLKRRYKIGEEVVASMVGAQRGGCAICGKPDPEHVDHDHTSREVRGILCFNCNAGLGHFKDNIANMRKAIAYLEETSWQRVMEAPGVYRLRSPRRERLRSLNS